MKLKSGLVGVFLALSLTGSALANGFEDKIEGLQAPVGLIYDQQGNLYVAEWGAGRVTKFTPQGERSTLTEAISAPSGLALDGAGTLYIASYGDGGVYALKPGGTPVKIASGFSSPTGLLWSRHNYLLVANRNAGQVVRLREDGAQDILYGGLATPVGLAETEDGNIFVSCFSGGVEMITPEGEKTTIYTRLATPGVGIIADGLDVLVVDYGGTTVTRLDRHGRAATVVDGLRSPVGLTRMPDGRLLVGTWADNAAMAFSLK